MEMDRFNGKAKEEDQGALALVLDLAKAFERVSLPVVGGLGNALQLPKEDLEGAVRVLRVPVACTVRRMCGRAAHDHNGYPATVEVELLALTDCVARCVR